jgi:hypothetical protein
MQIRVYIDVNSQSIDGATNIKWNQECVICNFQTNTSDCGVYMLTFGLFLADVQVSECLNINCKELARLKIALDCTRGYIEDPRLLDFNNDTYQNVNKNLTTFDFATAVSDLEEIEKVTDEGSYISKLQFELKQKDLELQRKEDYIALLKDHILQLENMLREDADEEEEKEEGEGEEDNDGDDDGGGMLD